MEKLLSRTVKDIFFRAVNPEYSERTLSTAGSFKEGGRFNPQGEFGALYLAESDVICEAELERKGIIPKKYHLGKIKVIFNKVLDLNDPKIIKKLKISLKGVLKKRDYTISQELGRWAHSKGYDAILYESVTKKGKAICIFDRAIQIGKNVILLEEWDIDKTVSSVKPGIARDNSSSGR